MIAHLSPNHSAVWGTIISIIGNTLGASAAFFISRFFLKEYVTKNLYSKYPTIQKYEARLFSKGIITILVLRLIPLFPFNILNYLLGVTQVKARDYLIGTAVGMIPGTIAYVYFGKALRWPLMPCVKMARGQLG